MDLRAVADREPGTTSLEAAGVHGEAGPTDPCYMRVALEMSCRRTTGLPGAL